MKYLKLFEELNFQPKKIFYTKDEGDSLVVYTFDFGDYTYLCEFSKTDNNVWRGDFHTMEEGFNTINIGSRNALETYAYIIQIVEDFINEYKPDTLNLISTSESRFNVSLKFIQNMKIDSNYTIKTFKDLLKTVIKK